MTPRLAMICAAWLCVSHAGAALAADGGAIEPVAEKPDGVGAICTLIESAADLHGLPKPFFTRLIWKESRFDVKAVSPAGAQGVAQFMPATAKRRGLADPFDPAQAIPASASLLADLRSDFGNLGLAAAAYNSGASRVSRWLSGVGGLPAETRDYVYSITGRPAEWFRTRTREAEPRPLDKDKSFRDSCLAMPVIATRAMPRPPWGVVIAGGRSRRAALVAYQRARHRLPRGAVNMEMFVVRRRRAGAGPLYAAGLGFGSRKEARAICLTIRRSGVPCTVRRL